MKKLLYIFLLLIAQNSRAQDGSEIQKLKEDLLRATDTDRINTLSLLCFNYSDVNFDSAQSFGNEALKEAANIHFAKGIADAYTNLSWAYYHHGDNIKARQYVTTALEKFKIIGEEKNYIAPLTHLGIIYLDEKNYVEALTDLKEALKYSEAENDKSRIGICLYDIGEVYNAEGNHARARTYFIQAKNIQLTLHDELQAATALSSIANTYQFDEKYDSALVYYKEVLPIFLKHGDLYRSGNAYENIGIALENKNQYSDAIENMEEAKKDYMQINSKTDIAFVEEEMGDVYMQSNNAKQAFVNYTNAIKLANEIPLPDLKRSLLANISDVYKQMGDYKNAYIFLDSSYKIKDSLFTKEKQDEFLKLQTQFETERKEKENQVLKTQNLSAAEELKENKIFLVAAISGLILLGGFLYALYRNRQTKINNIQKLEGLNTRLQKQQDEILRINTLLELKALRAQMNPHFIFNCMSSIQECILTGRVDDANTYLTKLSRLLRMVLNYADEEYIPLEKEVEMLALYLQLEKVRLKGVFEYSIKISDELLEEELKVPTLILQPFAENAIWHGLLNKPDNRLLNISGSINNDKLCFIIEDNGVGRKKAAELRPLQNPYKSKAMELAKKRLDIIKQQSGEEQTGFTIYDLYNPSGTKVEITLPIINS